MARKDDIICSFLTHSLLQTKYELKETEIPTSLKQALSSQVPIIRTLALIVDKLESTEQIKDTDLRNLITQYLNQSAI